MRMTLAEIAEFLGCELIGDKSVAIDGLSSLESASPGQLTFASEAKYIHRVNESSASAFIISEQLAEKITGRNVIVSKNPYYSFARMLSRYYEKEKIVRGIDKNVIISKDARVSEQASIYPNVFIDEGAVIHDGAVIYPGCFIGMNAVIGEKSLLYPNVVVREDCVIGKNVIIHPGTVIGGDGFGYILHEGEQHKIPQVGRVVIEDDVELGSNVTIDRAAIGETLIGKGTKIDNLVMVAHNVKTGKNCLVLGQAGMAGSAKLGDNVTLAAQAGTVGHIKIGDGSVVAARGGVTHDIAAGALVAGFPAIDANEWRKNTAIGNKLPEMRQKIRELEKRIKELETLKP